jgi:hypothetical protein
LDLSSERDDGFASAEQPELKSMSQRSVKTKSYVGASPSIASIAVISPTRTETRSWTPATSALSAAAAAISGTQSIAVEAVSIEQPTSKTCRSELTLCIAPSRRDNASISNASEVELLVVARASVPKEVAHSRQCWRTASLSIALSCPLPPRVSG